MHPSVRLEEVASPYGQVLGDSIDIDEFEGISNSSILLPSPIMVVQPPLAAYLETCRWACGTRHVRSEFPRGESGIG
jgi:hypothetical protein